MFGLQCSDASAPSSVAMEELEAAVFQGSLTEVVRSLKAKPLESFSTVPLEIAVAGETGSGKSSFINALLGLREDDPGAAKTGIQMTTVEIKDYPHPLFKQVTLWDLPGMGASPFGEGSHAEQVDLSRFDFFVIVGAQRFRTIHADLVHEIRKMGKSFYFVRTKADLDLEASRRQRPSGYSEEKILQHIEEDCRECLIREGVSDPQVFLVDNWETSRFDFPLLQEKLKQDLLRLKKEAFLLRLPSNCSPILEKKKAAIQKKIWTPAVFAAAIPVPGLSFLAAILLFRKFHARCYVDFGLDYQSLAVLAQLVGKPTAALRAAMKSLAMKPVVLRRLPEFLVGPVVVVAEYYYWRCFPLVGCMLTGGISLLSTYFMLQKCISDVAKDTQRVLAETLKVEEKKSV